MVISCVVVGCVNRFKSGSGVKFHRIPKESERRSKWLKATNRKKWTPDHNGDRVCGDHFLSGSAKNDPTDPDFIPHINMTYEKKELATPESKQARFQRVKRGNEDKSRRNKELVEMKDAASVLMEMSTVRNRSEHLNDSLESLVLLDHVDDKENETGADMHDPCLKKIASLQRENRQLLDEFSVLQDELRETRNKLGSAKFGDAFLAGGIRDARAGFDTGIPTYAAFLWLVQFCTSVFPTSMKLNPASVLMLVLMKLRLNTADMDLQVRSLASACQ